MRFFNSSSACSSRDKVLVCGVEDGGCGEVSAAFGVVEFDALSPNCPSLEDAELHSHPILPSML